MPDIRGETYGECKCSSHSYYLATLSPVWAVAGFKSMARLEVRVGVIDKFATIGVKFGFYSTPIGMLYELNECRTVSCKYCSQ